MKYVSELKTHEQESHKETSALPLGYKLPPNIPESSKAQAGSRLMLDWAQIL